MKTSIILFLALVCLTQGQVLLNAQTWAYFDQFVGGDNPTPCRPTADVKWGGPTQRNCSSAGFATPPNSQGRWGTAADTTVSGLGWQGIPATNVATDTDFYLGQLTHFNFPIYGPASGVNLNIILHVTNSGGQVIIQNDTYTFSMLIDETPNQGQVANCPYPSTIVCSDKITFSSFVTTKQFLVGGIAYTLAIQGFKESNQSGSAPIANFISNEKQQSVAYLFARFTAACPTSCANGANVIIQNGKCVCQCAANTCPSPLVITPNCSCTCPPKTCLNGGTVNPSNCACQCPICPAPQTVVGADCSCSCPTTSCAAGQMNTSTCACDCRNLTSCPVVGETRDGRCSCACQIDCSSNPKKKENPLSSKCECICINSTCSNQYFASDPNSCDCICNRQCHNSVVNNVTCTCGPCTGPWVKDNTTGDCTVCGLKPADCNTTGQVFDSTTCACLCPNINTLCDIQIGQVIDTTVPCGCRQCKKGECICGNGIVEDGEVCDNANPCCKNCTWANIPCDDGSACTQGDYCVGNGTCRGEYACLPSDDCNIRSCNNVTGCVLLQKANGTACRSMDLCHEQCINGLCTINDILCPADNDTTDCLTPVCSNVTGVCSYVTLTGTQCSDGDSCTTDDTCRQGKCVGTYKDCGISSNVCVNRTCVAGTCFDVPYANGLPCNYDNNSCTVGDYCVVGQCYPGSLKICNGTNACNFGACDRVTGRCYLGDITDSRPCDDNNNCTVNDKCLNGTCSGAIDQYQADNNPACGALPITTPSSVNNNSIIIFAVAGAAALIGAIAALAFLIKRIQNKKLLDAETWNPETISSVGSNPLYKGSAKTVDNRLYDGSM